MASLQLPGPVFSSIISNASSRAARSLCRSEIDKATEGWTGQANIMDWMFFGFPANTHVKNPTSRNAYMLDLENIISVTYSGKLNCLHVISIENVYQTTFSMLLRRFNFTVSEMIPLARSCTKLALFITTRFSNLEKGIVFFLWFLSDFPLYGISPCISIIFYFFKIFFIK